MAWLQKKEVRILQLSTLRLSLWLWKAWHYLPQVSKYPQLPWNCFPISRCTLHCWHRPTVQFSADVCYVSPFSRTGECFHVHKHIHGKAEDLQIRRKIERDEWWVTASERNAIHPSWVWVPPSHSLGWNNTQEWITLLLNICDKCLHFILWEQS